jgi:hypothetical protein
MTNFDDRLENYSTQFTLKKNRGEGGLTSKQRRRLLKKERVEHVREAAEGELTRKKK